VLNLVPRIPDLALGLRLVAAVGLGAFAGTLAFSDSRDDSAGQALSESVENIVEAIRATGAG
jgi:ABC-type phosphate/phosphonate transport system permease subunit